MKEKVLQFLAAVGGAIASFFCGLPPILWVLLAVMTLDYITGIICGCMGKSLKTEHGGLSSNTAFVGLMKKLLIIVIVALAYLLDHAVSLNVGVQFAAVSGATCLWFIASEGISVVENASLMGVPIPKALKQALEVMRGNDDKNSKTDNNKNDYTDPDDDF